MEFVVFMGLQLQYIWGLIGPRYRSYLGYLGPVGSSRFELKSADVTSARLA